MDFGTVEWVLLGLRGAGAILGAVFFVIVARAYLRTKARSMLVLGIATAFLTVASLSEGVSLQVLGDTDAALDTAHIIESILFLIAFSVLLWSVLTHRPEQRSG